MRIINLDMDGVVADFNLWVSNLLQRPVSWNEKDLTDDEWQILAKQERIYFQLPVIPESRELVNRALALSDFHTRFLTAIPRRATIPSAEQDKRDWVDIHFNGIPMEIGPFSKDKQKWCKPGDILIDDKELNVQQWRDAGGIAIFHSGNWKQTLDNFQAATKMSSDTSALLGL